MKDAFFRLIHRIYSCIYSMVLYATYFVVMRRMSKNAPRLITQEKQEILRFWKKYHVNLFSFDDYRWYKGKGKTVRPELMPEKIFHSRIEPYFTNLKLLDGFQDKNYYDTILNAENSPQCICHCINNALLDANYEAISEQDVVKKISDLGEEVICKPSMDSCGGKGIRFVEPDTVVVSEITDLIKENNGNFIIQRIVPQHDFFNRFNKTSLNTIRICSFLYKGSVHILSAFLRFGKAGAKVDNLSSGGLCIPIDGSGRFIDSVLDEDCNSYPAEVVTVDFVGQEIPNWNDITAAVRKYHFKLAHFQLINWDVALDKNGIPVIIEYNLIDTDAYCHQISVGPIFGDMTEEVLRDVFLK